MTEVTPHDRTDGLAARAKAMIASPKREWPQVAAESETVRDVFVGYVVPLAAIGPIAGFIGGQLFGYGAFGITYKPGLMTGLTTAVTSYVLALVSIFVISWIASFLAAKFGGKEDFTRAFRLCAYAMTAAWVAGIFGLIPALSILGLLGLYSLYVFYLGAEPMMGVPKDKAAGYTAVTVIAAIVLYIVVGVVAGAIAGTTGAAAALASREAATGTMEMNIPGYGDVTMESDGETQTMDIPGVGKVEVTGDESNQTVSIPGMGDFKVTRDGDTVKVQGEGFNAEVQDAPAE